LIPSYAARPITDWIIAIIYPFARLDVPLADIRRFQIFEALILDTIWFARNKLIHDNIQPVPAKTVQQLRITHEHHISAWQASTLSSLWSPPQPGCVKENFDVAICGNFAVAVAVISNELITRQCMGFFIII
jgi:hypothetical protein